MAAAIPAHVTLVYPDEHSGVAALRDRVKAVAEREAEFRVSLGDFRSFPPPDEGCVYIEVLDDGGHLRALRQSAVAPPFHPIEVPPHLTVVHPRTSDRAEEFWRARLVQNVRSQFLIDAITITSFENGGYVAEARFPLLRV
jgi:2'-5' RNA ligase